MAALAVCQGASVNEILKWRGTSTVETRDKAITHAARAGHTTPRLRNREPGKPSFVVDCIGLGAGPADQIAELGWHVELFNGAERAYNPARYRNRRSEAFWCFRDLLERDRAVLPRNELLLDEACAIEWSTSDAGLIATGSKDLLRKQLGRSIDRPDSVVTGLATAELQPRSRLFNYSLSW